MDYTNFQSYPLAILGIDESYDNELFAIEQTVISEIDYTGDEADLEDILPYFVFFKFCENRESETMANAGENYQVKEFSYPSVKSQIRAWNLGAQKLLDLCAEEGTEANLIYQSQRELI